MTCNELYCLLSRDARRLRSTQREYEDAACQRFQVVVRWVRHQEQSYDIYDQHMPDVRSTIFAKAIRLFSCVRFEHMRPETRQYFANYLRGVSSTTTSTYSLNEVVIKSLS